MRPPSGSPEGCWLSAALHLRPHDSRHRLDREGLAAAPAEARPAHDEDGCPVEDPVERAEQRPVAREELLPAADVDVGGEVSSSVCWYRQSDKDGTAGPVWMVP